MRDLLIGLGERMLARKSELLENGVPEAAEEAAVARTGIQDSPAKAAAKTSKPKPKKRKAA